MLIFLYGQDTYRIKEKIKEIVRNYKRANKSGLNLKNFDCLENNDSLFDEIEKDVRQASMFKEKKLLLVANPFSGSFFKETFLKKQDFFLESKNVILFYEEGEVDKKELFFKFLEEKAKCQEFKLLKGKKLKNWVKEKFVERNSNIDQNALELLCQYVGNDSWALSREIAKLAIFKVGEKIESKDVKEMVREKNETNIFKTIDAIAQKNKKLALDLLRSHLKKGDSPLYLLSMMSYQFKNLLIIKDLAERHLPYSVILKKSGLHPFVVRKTYYWAEKFELLQLKKIYQKIFQADIDIKTSKVEPQTALDLLISSV